MSTTQGGVSARTADGIDASRRVGWARAYAAEQALEVAQAERQRLALAFDVLADAFGRVIDRDRSRTWYSGFCGAADVLHFCVTIANGNASGDEATPEHMRQWVRDNPDWLATEWPDFAAGWDVLQADMAQAWHAAYKQLTPRPSGRCGKPLNASGDGYHFLCFDIFNSMYTFTKVHHRWSF